MNIRDLLDQPRDVLEQLCERRAQYAYLGDGVGLARVLSKYRMYVDTQDTSVAPHLIMDGYWESWISQTLAMIAPGTSCVDIGANHGYYTMMMAELGESKVYAFEPQKGLAGLVRKSSILNGYSKQVTVIESAVGMQNGYVQLIPPFGITHNRGSYFCSNEAQGYKDAVRVPVVRLDDVVKEKVGFIKIDAEGYEPYIWEGMPRILGTRPTILMEFTPIAYEDAAGFLDKIASCYSLREVDSGGSIVATSKEQLLDKNDFAMLWLEGS